MPVPPIIVGWVVECPAGTPLEQVVSVKLPQPSTITHTSAGDGFVHQHPFLGESLRMIEVETQSVARAWEIGKGADLDTRGQYESLKITPKLADGTDGAPQEFGEGVVALDPASARNRNAATATLRFYPNP